MGIIVRVIQHFLKGKFVNKNHNKGDFDIILLQKGCIVMFCLFDIFLL